MKTFLGIIFSIVFFGQAYSQTKVPFTLDDRDRIIRTEIELTSMRNEMNARFEAIDTKFEAMDTKFEAMDTKFEAMEGKIDVLFWGFGIVITLILFLFGYIVFDRRSTVKPLEQDVSVIKYRQDNLGKVINEFAKKDKGFAEALKKVAL